MVLVRAVTHDDIQLGELRRDDITSYTAGLGFRFTRTASLYGSYVHRSRDSTIPRFGYDANLFSIGVTLGIGP